MNSKENFWCSLALVSICFLCGVFIPNIADAMTVIGSTSNPLVGFSLPIIFYLKMDKLNGGNTSFLKPKRLVAHLINIIVILTGLLSLYLFIQGKINSV